MARRQKPRSKGEGWSPEAREYRDLSSVVLGLANEGLPRSVYMREVGRLLLRCADGDRLELVLSEEDQLTRWSVSRSDDGRVGVRTSFGPQAAETDFPAADELRSRLLEPGRRAPSRRRSKPDRFYTGDCLADLGGTERVPRNGAGEPSWLSLGCFRFAISEEDRGVLELRWRRRDALPEGRLLLMESLSQVLGIALANHRNQAAVRERVKELTCLYGLARIVERRDLGLEEILTQVPELLPRAWQYPEVACARIVLDGRTYTTEGCDRVVSAQSAIIAPHGEPRGSVEVGYQKPRPTADEGPFLAWERSLIDKIALELSVLVERKTADAQQARLHEQIRHADRLATIGQLSAGVAHELNEPLGSILGFAQLCKRQEDLSDQAGRDLDKLIAAALHAREIVRKLMLFARERPPHTEEVSLNEIVEEGLFFLESRGRKAGIRLVKRLDPSLPRLWADRGQLHQVLVNLVVNAIQAMPDGGDLCIETSHRDSAVLLAVEDSGVGMTEEVKKHLFVPFFTTKDVGDGTGLGLSVVHGIVRSHGGTISVESELGKGSRLEVRIPVTPRVSDGVREKP